MTNLIGTWCNLDRAYEIALLGGYSIELVCDINYHTAIDDYSKIKEFFTDVEFKTNGDLIVEIYKPTIKEINGNYRKISGIKEDVEKAKGRIKPNYFANEKSSDTLIKNAYEKLNLSIKDIEMIKSIAATISQLDSSKYINVEHVAEAIQYKAYFHDRLSLENNILNFGKGITISKLEIDRYDIDEAIKYLKSRL